MRSGVGRSMVGARHVSKAGVANGIISSESEDQICRKMWRSSLIGFFHSRLTFACKPRMHFPLYHPGLLPGYYFSLSAVKP